MQGTNAHALLAPALDFSAQDGIGPDSADKQVHTQSTLFWQLDRVYVSVCGDIRGDVCGLMCGDSRQGSEAHQQLGVRT